MKIYYVPTNEGHRHFNNARQAIELAQREADKSGCDQFVHSMDVAVDQRTMPAVLDGNGYATNLQDYKLVRSKI